MLCGYKDCDNPIPEGRYATTYALPEEQGLSPRPLYCSPECSLMVRLECYTVAPQNARGLAWKG